MGVDKDLGPVDPNFSFLNTMKSTYDPSFKIERCQVRFSVLIFHHSATTYSALDALREGSQNQKARKYGRAKPNPYSDLKKDFKHKI